jgi:hypothetical protein
MIGFTAINQLMLREKILRFPKAAGTNRDVQDVSGLQRDLRES